jgi:hypothetical protein
MIKWIFLNGQWLQLLPQQQLLQQLLLQQEVEKMEKNKINHYLNTNRSIHIL